MSRYKALGKNPWEPVVTPDGDILHVRYSQNMAGGIVEIRGGRPRIRDEFADLGYRFLADYYAEDEDPELRDSGMAVYIERQAAIDAGHVRRVPNEEGRMVYPPLDPEWLPAAVVAMQNGQAGAKSWQPPKREKKPKRGRPAKPIEG